MKLRLDRSGAQVLEAPQAGRFSAAAAASVAALNMALLVSVGTLAAGPLGRHGFPAGVTAALLSSILASVAVPLLARLDGLVTAPSPSIVLIYASLATSIATQPHAAVEVPQLAASLALCVVLSGTIVWTVGRLRIADAIKFLPSQVTAGFVTGIGLLLIWSQFGALAGIEGGVGTRAWSALAALVAPGALVCGMVAAATMVLYPRTKLPGPAPIAAFAAGTFVYHVWGALGGTTLLGPTVGAIDPAAAAVQSVRAAWSNITPRWLFEAVPHVLPYAALISFQIIMNGALSGAAVARITGQRPHINRTLCAQGLVTILCGLVAALPVSTNAALSLPAARLGATARQIVVSGLLLGAAFMLGGALAYVPVSVLAGILIVSGFNLIDRWAKGLTAHLWRGRDGDSHALLNLAVVAAVAAALFYGGVPLALSIGTALALMLLAINLSRSTRFDTYPGTSIRSTRVWPPDQADWLATRRECIAMLRPRGGLFFGNADQLETRLASLSSPIRYCVLDLSKTNTLDATACQVIAGAARTLAGRKIELLLAGIGTDTRRHAELVSLGLVAPAANQWFADADMALEWTEAELLGQRWSDSVGGNATTWRESPVFAALTSAQLTQVDAIARIRTIRPGTMFRRGDPGNSMFIIESGRIELTVTDPDTGSVSRLACMGPGSTLGEIGLLLGGMRTADAVCMEDTQVCEITREGMAQLDAHYPAVYDRIMRNLAMLLAQRLATSNITVRVLH